MKRIIVLISLMFFAFTFVDGQVKQYKDVVYLKDGSIRKGLITEQIPGQSLKIQITDGSVFVYSMDDVLRIAKEESHTSYSSYTPQYQQKNPALAWMCSFFLPGLGQMVINKQYGKGVGMLVGSVAASVVSIVGADIYYDNNNNYDAYYGGYDSSKENLGIALVCGGALVGLGIWIWSMVDAPVHAKKLNAKNLLTWELGEATLKLRPDLTMNNVQVYSQNRIQPTVGMKLSFDF